jgi:hypothetical protein
MAQRRARHPAHCREHPLIEGRLAKLIDGQVDVDPDHLDHVPAQDREVLFLHRQLFSCFGSAAAGACPAPLR